MDEARGNNRLVKGITEGRGKETKIEADEVRWISSFEVKRNYIIEWETTNTFLKISNKAMNFPEKSPCCSIIVY